jgi:hypothetical protein
MKEKEGVPAGGHNHKSADIPEDAVDVSKDCLS